MFQATVFAAVNVGQRTGTFRITNPDGTVATVAPGDPLPAIADGATIEVVDGDVQVSTTDGYTVNFVAGGRTFQAAAGTTVNVTFESSGVFLVEVTAGRVTLITADNGTATLNPGAQVRVGSAVTSATGFEMVKGEVSLTDANGTTTTLTSAGNNSLGDLGNMGLDTEVQSEETSRDISPVKG